MNVRLSPKTQKLEYVNNVAIWRASFATLALKPERVAIRTTETTAVILLTGLVVDADVTWRIVYRVDTDAIVIGEVFAKKTPATPRSVIDACKRRFREYDDA